MKHPWLYMIALVWTVLSPFSPSSLTALPHVTHTQAVSSDETWATIWQSASTNTCSSLLQIASTGFSTYLLCQHTRGEGMVPQALTRALFQDLKAAQPLNRLSITPVCLKPVSFGVAIYIVYANQISPDLDCVEGIIGRRLVWDIHRIQQTLWDHNDLWTNQRYSGDETPTPDTWTRSQG